MSDHLNTTATTTVHYGTISANWVYLSALPGEERRDRSVLGGQNGLMPWFELS
jgi:hypothetical protein